LLGIVRLHKFSFGLLPCQATKTPRWSNRGVGVHEIRERFKMLSSDRRPLPLQITVDEQPENGNSFSGTEF
jgi:hypothetical protein